MGAIDSHIHINSKVIDDVNTEIAKVNTNPSLHKVINVGLDAKTSEEASLIAEDNPKFYASIGIHPAYITDEYLSFLYEYGTKPKVVAIGEICLDTSIPNYDIQKEYLIKQISIANELGLPVIIHANNSNDEITRIFKTQIKPLQGCVFHCFQPDEKTLFYLIDQGYYISFAGRITYQTAKRSHDILRLVPNNLFLIETDAPFITPEPYRNQINEASNLRYIIQKVSEIKDIDYEEVERITEKNTHTLFKKLR